MAGPWCAFACKKSFARRGCARCSVWPRVRSGAFDGHARRDPGTIDGVVDSTGDRPFVPESFSVDAAAWTDRGCVFLAAGARTASRGERTKIFFAGLACAAGGIPAIFARGWRFGAGVICL